MFMSPVPARRLCFRRICFVAGIFDASGNMNTFSDRRPVSWKKFMSISAPAPDVQPVSKMPDLFDIFHFHLSAVLFFTVGFDDSDMIVRRCSTHGWWVVIFFLLLFD